ncbi:hypothetical protein CoNPh26_CDS0048 [Staphylococcus phage S-CoN_Ph26]|nr:hypothetical protein CoNPh26_CDS0048 [Staphylococcus phage S-CoN_Ph26]
MKDSNWEKHQNIEGYRKDKRLLICVNQKQMKKTKI